MAETIITTQEIWVTRREEARRAWYRFRSSTLALVGLGIVLGMAAVAILAPYIAPYPQHAGGFVDFANTFQPPSRAHLFGTDDVGRDVFTRVLFGARISLFTGFVVLSIALAIGIPLGLIAGYWTGWVSSLIMRITDVFLALPSIVLALAVAAVLKPTLTNAMIAIAFTWWPWYTRLVYVEVLSIKQEAFVEASRSMGASPWRIAFREILPNAWSPIVVKLTLDMGFVILVETGLSFLGLGAQPPTPAWGAMIAEGRIYMPANWWLATFPGLAIFLTVLGFNLLGDGLRDVFDVQIEQWRGGA